MHLIPFIIQHDSATNGHASLVLHEIKVGLFVVVTPSSQERTRVEEHFREFFKRERRKFGVLFSNEVLVVPVPVTGSHSTQ